MSVPVSLAIRVFLRSDLDYSASVTGELVVKLREVGGVVNLLGTKPDPKQNPLALGIEIGRVEQLAAVREIAGEWIKAPLSEGERMERIVAILLPDAKLITYVMMDESGLGERIILNPEDAELAK